MQINLPASLVGKAKAVGIKFTDRYRNQEEPLELNLRFMEKKELDAFEKMLAENPEGVGIRRQISSWRKAAADPSNTRPGSLNVAEAAFIDYFVNDAIEGWLFPMTPEPRPALISAVTYHPAERDSPASLVIRLTRRTDEGSESVSIYFDGDDVKGQTLLDMLTKAGWQKETPELVAQYTESVVRFQKLRGMFGQQLQLTVPTEVNLRKNWWEEGKSVLDLMSLGAGRVVCDRREGAAREKGRSYGQGRSTRERRAANETDVSSLRQAVTEKYGEDAQPFTAVPWELSIRCFHLEAHTHLEPHVDHLKVYEYDLKVRDKLILPEETMELLDTLTEEMDLVQEDIVGGKSGGNVVMLAGEPGVGKTLTAEVFAEYRKAPLYKVHSGQLGINPKEIEEQLKVVYQRATAWGNTIILLDEFDVFGRARGNDLTQNAVVAVFLRTLEYQNNTIFLTTNRAADMDDAIVSRCAAILNYTRPKGENVPRIWRTLRDQYLSSLSDEVIDGLLLKPGIPELSGRDIKGVLRLAARYERRGFKIDEALILKCARFRGIQNV